MPWQQIIQPAATLTAAFLGPYLAFRLARRHQESKDKIEKALERTKQTLLVLASYEDPHFSDRRLTLAEFQRDWDKKQQTIVDIVFPPKGQTVAAFFGDSPDCIELLRQHQNVNRFLAFISMLTLYHDQNLIDQRVLKIFIPRYNAYGPFIRNLRSAVEDRCQKEQIDSPYWCGAVPELERIFTLPNVIQKESYLSKFRGVVRRFFRMAGSRPNAETNDRRARS